MPAPDPLLGYATEELRFDTLLGRGGMGAVYRGRQLRLDRAVAIKVIKPDLAADPAYLERFTREARTMGRLVHANVVACHDFGPIAGPGGEPLTVMVLEFIDGASLGGLQRQRSLAVREVLGLYRQACEGLAAAHAIGVVHRDIKPDNIMVAADGTAKIADFGLARAEDAAQLTQTGALLGSPAYMSPEASRGDEPRPASDIYSLGCSLFQSLTGRPPFQATSTLQVLHQHLTVAPPRLTDLRPDLAVLDALLARCLDKDPQQRPEAAALARELARLAPQVPPALQAGHASATPPASAVARTVAAVPRPAPAAEARPRPSYRRLWLGGAVCAVLLLVVLGAAGNRARPPAAPADPPPEPRRDAPAPVPPPTAAAPAAPRAFALLGAELAPGRSEAPAGAPAPPGQAPRTVMSQLGRIRVRLPAGATSLCLVLHPGAGEARRRLRLGEATVELEAGAWSVLRAPVAAGSDEVVLAGDGAPFFCAAGAPGIGREADWADLGVRANALLAVEPDAMRELCARMARAPGAALPATGRTRVVAAPAVHALLGMRLRETWESAFTGPGDRRLVDKTTDFAAACQEAAHDGVRWTFLMLDAREAPSGRARAEDFALGVESTLRESGMLLLPVVGGGIAGPAVRSAWRQWTAELHRRVPGLPILDLRAAADFAERNHLPADPLRWNEPLDIGLRELRARIEAAVPRQPQP